MKNKGFTLVEVIGVIVILALIVIVGVPAMTKSLKKANEDEIERFEKDLFIAAENYVANNESEFLGLGNSGGQGFVTLEKLKQAGYIKSSISDPKTELNYDDIKTSYILMTNNDGEISYTYVRDGSSISELNTDDDNDEDPSQQQQTPISNSYISDGLILRYDALDNTGSGHDNGATVWKDLSGKGNDATIYGATWTDDYLSFDGVDDYAVGPVLTSKNVTLEIIYETNSLSETSKQLITTWSGPGFGIYNNTKKNNVIFQSSDSSGYTIGSIYGDMTLGVKNSVMFAINADTSIETLCMTYISNNKNTWGCYSTWKQLGGFNQSTYPLTMGKRADLNIEYFSGKIYAVRVYNRALSTSEAQHNYKIDEARYGI